MKWEDLDEKHRLNMEELGNFVPTANITHRELKGYMGDCKVYLDSKDLREISDALIIRHAEARAKGLRISGEPLKRINEDSGINKLTRQ